MKILPDETSEGNRRDLMMFFPSKLSQNGSRLGSISARSASNNSFSRQDNTSTFARAKTSRLDVNVKQNAGAAILSHGCKGKRICTVSDMSSHQ